VKPGEFSVDFRSDVPTYVQIVDQVRDALAGGNLKPGDQLPTVRQMAAELRVNFNTIARAYRLLDDAGLISTQQGRGTFIIEPLEKEKTQSLMQSTLNLQVQRFLQQLERQAYAPDDVLMSLTENIRAWRAGELSKNKLKDMNE